MLEFENVGDGLTGPIDRREAAKSGSRPSMSMAGKSLVIVSFRILRLLHGRDLEESLASVTYHQTSRWMLAPLSGMLDLEREL